MNKTILLIILALSYAVNMNGQNFTFIGENSYPSTDKFTLQSNSENEDIGDLNLVFAKDKTTLLIVVSSKLTNVVKIAKKLIIYLDDGTVISCTDRGINDNVDDIAISAYHLTNAELNKMKNSNINTIRYEIVCPVCGLVNFWEGVYSASNKGDSRTDFTKIIKSFFKV